MVRKIKNKKVKFTQEEKVILSKFLGIKLAIFIDNLNFSKDTKELLINLLPDLAKEDLIKFINILEEKYASQETELLDVEFENELAKIAIKHGNAQKEVDEQTLQKMSTLFKKRK